MVIVNRRGRLGNVLFQYTFGRLLAAPRGLAVVKNFEYPGIPEVRNVPGLEIRDRGTLICDCEANEGKVFDIEALSKMDCGFMVDGFFQHRSYYEAHRKQIKEWLFDVPRTEEAIGIHMRFGDYVPLKWDLPWEYYAKAISNCTGGKLIIFTDDPSHYYVSRLKMLGAEVSGLSEVNDLKRLASCKEIVMSRSSFSWWAAFLSNASHVCFPRPNEGWWSMNDTPHKDLFLDYPEYEPIHF